MVHLFLVLQRLMDVNYFGSVCATKAVVEGMKQRECGRIVFVSSQAGQLGVCGFSGYSASKYALRGLAESLQMEVIRTDLKNKYRDLQLMEVQIMYGLMAIS